jgi:hypothetical protein
MDDMFMSGLHHFISDLGLQRYGDSGAPVEAPYGWIGDDGSTLLLFADLDLALAEVRRYSAQRRTCVRRAAAGAVVDLRGAYRGHATPSG